MAAAQQPSPPPPPPARPSGPVPVPRLLEHYRKSVVPDLVKRFSYKNPMQAPRLTKVVLNMGVGQGAQDVKVIEKAAQEMAVICGQKPVITRAKKAISNFKIKENQPVGVKVTLRRYRMYEFLDRLFNIAMPRIRDFRGMEIRRGFDQGGNYALGLTEQLIFPEIEYDKVSRVQGMDVVICTTARNREEAAELLRQMGMPFKQKDKD
ncbi:MAG: 50S ribosomal protein L5 [Candidatus Omnitrophica bacterium]|nr:50S ribosomal protein L5 [Candidatus Omnitrophota bacterium]